MQAVNLSPAAMGMFRAVSYVLPNFENFNVMGVVAHGRPVPAALVWQSTVYAALYGAIVLAGAALVFSRRNLK
jgi:ABC-type transport system involved in multi-copper enzyme maturation permease subunit